VSARESCREALRQAVPALEAAAPAQASSQHLRAWLTLYQLTERRGWLDKLRAAVSPHALSKLPAEQRGEWIRICCDCWVVDAMGPFRGAVSSLLRELQGGPAAVPALLRNWRITGDRSYAERAFEQLPASPGVGAYAAAAAYLAAYHARGKPEHLHAAAAAFEGAAPADIPLRWWPLAWDVLRWSPTDLSDAIAPWVESAPAPEDVLPALVAASLPAIDLQVLWYEPRELEEGYVAEAVTFPYPALRLRFQRMDVPGQVRFAPSLDGEEREPLEDAGVVATLLSHLVEEVDRQSVVGATRARPGRGRLRR
jgi:hypothetical protein